MQSDIRQFEVTLAEQEFTLESGRVANNAGGAVTLRVGDTLVLAAATMSKDRRYGNRLLPINCGF